MPISPGASRFEILQTIRRQNLPHETLPATLTDGVHYTDPIARFSEVLAMVGGQCVHVPTLDDAHLFLEKLPNYQSASQRISMCPGIGETNVSLANLLSPHDFNEVDYAILPGRLAVAENAAVWVTGGDAPHRVLYFITQHLALVVPSRHIVNNLCQAYTQIDVTESPFTAWISGPSKTADIEQSLVIGAHGPRSLVVFLVDELNTST